MPRIGRPLTPIKQLGRYVRTKDGSRKRWGVYLPAGSRPSRRFFRTEAEAAKFCEAERATLKQLGVPGLQFTQANRKEAAECFRKLARYNGPGGRPASLMAAVDFFIQEKELRLASLRVSDAAEEYLGRLSKRGRGLRYIEQVRYLLRGFCRVFGAEPIAALRRGKIQDWLDARTAKEGLSLKTQNNLIGSVRGFLKWAAGVGLMESNPAVGLEASGRAEMKKDRLLPPADFELMLANSPDSLRPIIALLGLTGVRVAESARLRWEDISGGVLYVDRDAAKTETDREAKLTPALAAYLQSCRPADAKAYIFPTSVFSHPRDAAKATNPAKVDLARVRALAKKLSKLRKFLGGRDKFKPNTLRVSFISYRLSFKTFEEVAAEAGHDTRITRKNYKQRRISEEDARKWFEIDPARPKAAKRKTWKEWVAEMDEADAREAERAEEWDEGEANDLD
jgi:integrase